MWFFYKYSENDIANAKAFRNKLDYLVQAISRAKEASEDDIRCKLGKEVSMQAVQSGIKSHPDIQRALYRANIIRNDRKFLLYMGQTPASNLINDASGLIDLLNDDGQRSIDMGNGQSYTTPSHITAYRRNRSMVIFESVRENNRRSQKIIGGLYILAIVGFGLTILGYILFNILAASLANPAAAIAVGNLFISICFYGVCMGSLAAAFMTWAGNAGWNKASSRVDNWSTNRLAASYSKRFDGDALLEESEQLDEPLEGIKELIDLEYRGVKDEIAAQLASASSNNLF